MDIAAVPNAEERSTSHKPGHPARAGTSRRLVAQIAGSPQRRGVHDQMLPEPGNPVHSGQSTLGAAAQAADVTLVLFGVSPSAHHIVRALRMGLAEA